MFFILKSGENIVLVLRRHWLVLSLSILKFVPFFALPLIVWFLLAIRFDIVNPLINSLFWLASSLFWLLLWAAMAVTWVDLYLDFWVITNQRVVSTYQKGLFRREVSELPLTRIQDLTVSVKGIIQTFLNYGHLEIRTAGTFETIEKENANVNVFIFENIPNPYQVQNIISQIHRDFYKSLQPNK